MKSLSFFSLAFFFWYPIVIISLALLMVIMDTWYYICISEDYYGSLILTCIQISASKQPSAGWTWLGRYAKTDWTAQGRVFSSQVETLFFPVAKPWLVHKYREVMWGWIIIYRLFQHENYGDIIEKWSLIDHQKGDYTLRDVGDPVDQLGNPFEQKGWHVRFSRHCSHGTCPVLCRKGQKTFHRLVKIN